MSRIFLHQPSLRKLKGLLHIQSYSTNWNNKPKKKKKTNPKTILASETLPTFFVMQLCGKGSSPRSCQCRVPPHRDRAKPNQSLHSQVHMCCICCCFCLLLDGTKLIGGHFSNHFWKENISPVTCNELRTKKEWHPAQLLNYHSVK